MRDRLILFLSLMLALACLVPDHFFPWPAFRNDFVIGLGVFPIILWTAWRRFAKSRFLVFGFLFSVTPLLQVVFKEIEFSGDGWIVWLYLTGAILALLSGEQFVATLSHRSLHRLTPLMTAWVIAALFSIGIALAQWLNLDIFNTFSSSISIGARPSANLGQPNQLATLILLGIVGAIFLFEGGFIRGRTAIAASSIFIFGLAMTQSRMVLLALCLTWLAYWGMRRRSGLRTSPKAVIYLTSLFVLSTWTWPLLNRALLLPNAISLADRMETGQNLRATLWRSMADAIAQFPWGGYGWNQVPLAQHATALNYPATYWMFDSAHNLFLDLAIWVGLPVALGVAIWLFVWFKRQAVACQDPMSWCVLLAVSMVFCHATVEYPLSYAYFLLPTAFLMGALNQSNSSSVTERNLSPALLPRWLSFGFSLIVLVMFAIISVEYIRFESEWRRIRLEMAHIGPASTEKPLNIIFLTQLREYAGFVQTEPTRGMSDQRLEWMRHVTERYGWASSLTRYAIAAALNGQPQAAAHSLAVLCKTQSPLLCSRAIQDWRSMAADGSYPELRNVILPGEAVP